MLAQTRAISAISERNRQNAKRSHHNTPTKVRIRSAIDIRNVTQSYAGNITNKAIFDKSNVSKSAGYRMLSKRTEINRRFSHTDLLSWKETRRAPDLVIAAYIQRMEAIIEAADVEERSMTWEQLGIEAEVYNPEFLKDGSCSKKAGKLVSGRTIQRAMGTMDYHKCVAC